MCLKCSTHFCDFIDTLFAIFGRVELKLLNLQDTAVFWLFWKLTETEITRARHLARPDWSIPVHADRPLDRARGHRIWTDLDGSDLLAEGV